jgi:hypothetical protein
MKCYGCSVEKDLNILEVYPWPEDDRLCTDPIDPLMVLECQGKSERNGPNGEWCWKAVVVCHACFRKLDPDMWIGENCWISINPRIPFDDLPEVVTTKEIMWEPSSYPELA